MSAFLTLLLAILGFTTVNDVPKQYVHETKDGIIFINPTIAKEYDAHCYDQIKNDVYTIQENAYPNGLSDFLGAN